uniref:Putative terminase n=1 Tax=viral metagenome TaxID=1070528 RepID=A0A6M3JSR4_9ZZZZ
MFDKQLEGVLSECYLDTKTCAKTLFPDLFYADFSPLHNQIFELIDSGAQKIAIAAPRGIGKTTIARTVASKGILFRDINFISYVSNSATVAELQTENIKRELISNSDVKSLFGSIKVSDAELEMEESFSKLSWVAFGNTLVLPRGAGQQVRGLLWRNHRPQLIIVDDLEDKEEIMNENNRMKLKEWFFSDLLKSINRYKNDWRIIYIDTLKHEDALLQTLIDSDDWESIVLSICDDSYNSYAPNYITTEELKKEVEAHRKAGMLDVFYMEFMNMPVSAENASFRPQYFKYYEEPDLANKSNIENIVLLDPAKTIQVQNADSAIVGVGIDRAGAGIYVRDIVSGKMYPDEIYDEYFSMLKRLNSRIGGIEVTSLNEFIVQPIRNEMFKRGQFFELVELKPRMKKEDRIAALVPFYRQGYMYHNKTCCAKLEAQLLSFPRSKLWDVMDALAYVIQMLEKGERYFEPQDVKDDSDNKSFDSEAEFKELEMEYEPAFAGWRTV